MKYFLNFITILCLFACQHKVEKNQSDGEVKKAIFQIILNDIEISSLLKNYPKDTIYVIKSLDISSMDSLRFNKVILLSNRPKGYPKYTQGFDYSKFQLSFEGFTIKQNQANGFLLIKTIGVLYQINLTKKNNKWHIIKKEKMMI